MWDGFVWKCKLPSCYRQLLVVAATVVILHFSHRVTRCRCRLVDVTIVMHPGVVSRVVGRWILTLAHSQSDLLIPPGNVSFLLPVLSCCTYTFKTSVGRYSRYFVVFICCGSVAPLVAPYCLTQLSVHWMYRGNSMSCTFGFWTSGFSFVLFIDGHYLFCYCLVVYTCVYVCTRVYMWLFYEQ